MFWSSLLQCRLTQAATTDDPASGLPARDAFVCRAERALAQCYDQGEPAALVIVAVEGIRALNDSCQWRTADELVKEISDELKRKVRIDDCAGRFDEGRFVILLKRVDSELAALITEQLTTRLQRICSSESRWGAKLAVRGGLAGSGLDHPDLKELLTRALAQCERARKATVSVATDLNAASETTIAQTDPAAADLEPANACSAEVSAPSSSSREHQKGSSDSPEVPVTGAQNAVRGDWANDEPRIHVEAMKH